MAYALRRRLVGPQRADRTACRRRAPERSSSRRACSWCCRRPARRRRGGCRSQARIGLACTGKSVIGLMPFHRRKKTAPSDAAGAGQVPWMLVSASVPLCGSVASAVAVMRPGAEHRVALERFEIEARQPAMIDHLVVGGDRNMPVRWRRPSKTPRPSRPPLNCDHLNRAHAAGRLGDLDAVEIVLEAGIAAAGFDRAVAGDDDRRIRRDRELALGGEIVGRRGDRTAIVVGSEAHQLQRCADAHALGGVGAAERRLEQVQGLLEGAHALLPDFQHDGVAHARRDVADRRPAASAAAAPDRSPSPSSGAVPARWTSSPSAHTRPGLELHRHRAADDACRRSP